MAIFTSDTATAMPFLAKMGEMLVRWNHAEADMRLMVALLGQESLTVDILTAHMSNRYRQAPMADRRDHDPHDLWRGHHPSLGVSQRR